MKYKGDVYQCPICGKVYLNEESADRCCEPKKCACGEIVSIYRTQCDSCNKLELKRWANEKYEKAPKMTVAEYIEKFPNNGVFVGENYYDDIDYAIESNEGEDFVMYGSEETYCILDTENMIESALEDAHEDAEFDADALAELEEFITQWNEKHRLLCYSETNLVILPDKEVKDD
jgi:hypothetical protein